MVWFLCIVGLGVLCTVCCFLYVSMWGLVKRISKHEMIRDKKKKVITTSLVRIYIAILFMGIFSTVTNAYPVFTQDISGNRGEKKQICTLDNDPKKEIEDIFSPNSDKGEEEALKREIDKKLHVEWAEEGFNYHGYGEKIVELYFSVPQRDDEPYEQNSEDAKKIKAYNMTIREIQTKRCQDDAITKEELKDEKEAYWQSFLIRSVAQMAYQAGRSSEDFFWGQAHLDDELRKSGADAVYAFETFLEFVDREVGEGEQKRVVSVEEILLRNGKTFFRLGTTTEDEKQKRHYLFCAYGLFSNVNLEGTEILDNPSINENVMLAEYYKGLTIASLPLDLVDDILIDEMKTSFEVANQLLEKNELATEKTKQKEEQNMSLRLEELGNKIPRIEKWKK